MSRQRKHIEEMLYHFPEPKDNEQIAKVIEAKGRNILEIEYSDQTRVLALIPAKYHKKVWIKNGNFVIVEPTFLPDSTSKVLAVVTHPFLTPEDIQNLVDTNIWPPEFLAFVKEMHHVTPKPEQTEKSSVYLDMDFMSDDDEESGDEWNHNPNHCQEYDDGSSSEE